MEHYLGEERVTVKNQSFVQVVKMSKGVVMVAMTTLLLLVVYIVPTHAQVLPVGNDPPSIDIPSIHPKPDSSPIVAVIIINRDADGTVTFVPNNVTIKVDDEILVLNNDTTSQSMTNGMNPDDPLAGKIFDTGPIPPKGFVEIAFPYFKPGTYPFYSTNSISTKGVIAIEPKA
jgi:hypothetical protein